MYAQPNVNHQPQQYAFIRNCHKILGNPENMNPSAFSQYIAQNSMSGAYDVVLALI